MTRLESCKIFIAALWSFFGVTRYEGFINCCLRNHAVFFNDFTVDRISSSKVVEFFKKQESGLEFLESSLTILSISFCTCCYYYAKIVSSAGQTIVDRVNTRKLSAKNSLVLIPLRHAKTVPSHAKNFTALPPVERGVCSVSGPTRLFYQIFCGHGFLFVWLSRRRLFDLRRYRLAFSRRESTRRMIQV